MAAFFVTAADGAVLGEYDDLVAAKRALDTSEKGKAVFRRADGLMMASRSVSQPGGPSGSGIAFFPKRARRRR